MISPQEQFLMWWRSARNVFRHDCKEYGRPLALKLLYTAYTRDYQMYMRWRDDGTTDTLVAFAYRVAMARLALCWREGAVNA